MGIQSPMAQGRSIKISSMIQWIRTKRLSIENSVPPPSAGWGVCEDEVRDAQLQPVPRIRADAPISSTVFGIRSQACKRHDQLPHAYAPLPGPSSQVRSLQMRESMVAMFVQIGEKMHSSGHVEDQGLHAHSPLQHARLLEGVVGVERLGFGI